MPSLSVVMAVTVAEHGRQVLHLRVAFRDGLQAEAVHQCGDDRRRVVRRAVDAEPAVQARCERERRDPAARPHVVARPRRGGALAGRRDVVPLAAELVVGDDHHRVLLAARPAHGAQQVDHVVGARVLAGVAGVLVLGADRLDEADRLELAAAIRSVRERLELVFVAQVLDPRLRAGRVVLVVVERLVVVLEQLVRAVREDRAGRRLGVGAGSRPVRPARSADVAVGVRPAARVPRPVDALLAQPVADRRALLRRQPARRRGAGRVRLVWRLDRVDGPVAAGQPRRVRRGARHVSAASLTAPVAVYSG